MSSQTHLIQGRITPTPELTRYTETEDAANFLLAMDEAVKLSDGGPIELQRYDNDHYIEYQIKFQGTIPVHCSKY